MSECLVVSCMALQRRTPSAREAGTRRSREMTAAPPLFPPARDANAGVFEAVLTKDDVIISDRLVHASLVDGIRLCSAMHDTIKHSDMGHLEEKLQLHAGKRFKLVVTDGVFSMDGDTAKLDEMVRISEKYDAMVLVDETPCVRPL